VGKHVQVDSYYEHENNTGKKPNQQHNYLAWLFAFTSLSRMIRIRQLPKRNETESEKCSGSQLFAIVPFGREEALVETGRPRFQCPLNVGQGEGGDAGG